MGMSGLKQLELTRISQKRPVPKGLKIHCGTRKGLKLPLGLEVRCELVKGWFR
jgi:hypothetical protein